MFAGPLAHPRAAFLRFFLARQRFVGISLGMYRGFLLVMEGVLEPMVAAAIGAGLRRGEDQKRGEDQHRLAAFPHFQSPLRNFRTREFHRPNCPAKSICS